MPAAKLFAVRVEERCILTAVLLLAALPTSSMALPPGELYATRPGQVWILRDLNLDGDYADFNEAALYADGLHAGISAIAHHDGRLLVLSPATGQIVALHDLNGDGDALDFGEALLHAQLPAPPSSGATGITAAPDGSLLVTDATCGCLHRVRDENGDGDALDAGEIVTIATGLSMPQAVTIRPDGKLLVSQENGAVPVRILHDRDGDGDYLDFAENISYAEAIASGKHIAAMQSDLSFLLRIADARVIMLVDLNGDDDVLDFAEVRTYAEGLASPQAMALTPQAGLLVAGGGASGAIHFIHDANEDGDALDFGEVLLVAEGITQCQGLVFVPEPVTGCVKGDANGDQLVNMADVPLMIEAILTKITAEGACALDMNDDGAINALDLQGFADALLD